MTSSSITDFLISASFLGAGGYALLARIRRGAGAPKSRDQHETIPGGGRRRGDGPRSVGH
jgi:hypothetical protein